MPEQIADRSAKRRLRQVLAVIGPGFMTAAVVLGPGSITVSSKAGATYGYTLLWTLVLAGGMMICFTAMGARIGMAVERSFLHTVATRHDRGIATLIGVCGFLICTGFQTVNNVGVGMAMNALVGGSPRLWAVVFTALALALMWSASSVYRLLERMMVALVALMIVCFVGNLVRVRPSLIGIAAGLVPRKPEEIGLVTAISATTFSVAAAAFQPYLIQSKGWRRRDVRWGIRDASAGICTLTGVSCVIMITAATVLKPEGITVTNAVDMAAQLTPLLGPAATTLFLLGFWAGAFSSFIMNAIIGGGLLADGVGLSGDLASRWTKGLASGVMVLGTIVALIFGKSPVELIVVAQATTILGVPLIAYVMVLIANDDTVMGDLRNGPVTNAIAVAAILWLLYLSGHQLFRLFG